MPSAGSLVAARIHRRSTSFRGLGCESSQTLTQLALHYRILRAEHRLHHGMPGWTVHAFTASQLSPASATFPIQSPSVTGPDASHSATQFCALHSLGRAVTLIDQAVTQEETFVKVGQFSAAIHDVSLVKRSFKSGSFQNPHTLIDTFLIVCFVLTARRLR